MNKYSGQTRYLVALDCIIFGFDGEHFKLLLIKRGFEPEQGNWSLMGGFLQPQEDLDNAAVRILKSLTGLDNIFMEQMKVFSSPQRDPVERTLAVAYVALIDIQKYKQQLSQEYHAQWFLLNQLPQLIFDHQEMVEMAKKQLRYKAALHPLLFELLPQKFTLPQLQALYSGLYEVEFDKRNFSRKMLSTGLLIKLQEKDKENSKKGAYYYQLDQKKYKEDFESILSIIPKPGTLF